MSRKDLLSYEDLIKKMQTMGIRFNIVNKDTAINVMRIITTFSNLGLLEKISKRTIKITDTI